MTGRWIAGCLLIAGALLAATPPVSAKILKTRKSSQAQALELTVGSGVEYESDGDQTEYGFPFLVEYGFTKRLKLTVEPQYTVINSSVGDSASGMGDLETGLTFDLVPERRYRPLFSMQALIKWPTAKDPIGTEKADYSLGTILSKEFSNWDTEFNALYTLVGSPPGESLSNTLELSVAATWRFTPKQELEAELVTSSGSVQGTAGSISGIGSNGAGNQNGGRESEATIGLAQYLTHRLKLEEGVVVKLDGGWQAVIAWEFDFGEGK